MRILLLELENYIGIYNGSGLHKLKIDFSKCINKITVIRGANGSGKSSLFKTIHPFSDTSYYLIPGLTAKKRIVYEIDSSTVIDIKYTYPDGGKGDGSRKPTTCEVFLNGVDVNTTKNVNTGKDVICDIMDIDSGFLTLGQLSSEDKGLVDKKPSDRKRFINTKLAELDVYNTIYKKITKKSLELKGLVNSLSNDINNIGDVNAIQSNIYLWEGQLESLEETKLTMIRDMTEMNLRMHDIFGDDIEPDDQYLLLQREMKDIEKSIELYKDCIDCTEEELKDHEYYRDKCKSSLDNANKDLLRLTNELSDINSKITELKTRISAIGDIDLLDKYKVRIDELKANKEAFERVCEEHGFYKYADISVDEYNYSIRTYKMIHNQEQSIKLTYSNGEIEEAVNTFNGESQLEDEEELQQSLDEITKYAQDLVQTLNQQNFYKEQSKGITNIPKECTLKNECPFVKNMVEANNKLISEAEEEKLIKYLNQCNNDIKDIKNRLNEVRNINRCLAEIHNLYNLESSAKSTLLKFCKNTPRNINDYNDMIRSSLLGRSWFDFDWNYYNDLSNAFIIYKSYQADIDKLEAQYKSLSKNEELLVYMNSQLHDLMDKKIIVDKEYHHVSAQVIDLDRELDQATAFVELYKDRLEKKNSIDSLNKRYKELTDELENFSVKYDKYKSINDKFEEIKIQMKLIDSEQIPSLKNRISDAKYKLVIYNDYVSKYNKYSKEYEKIEVIKYCCSPTTGIQTIYAEMYMNKILGISNQLLSMFFGGEFVMQPFIINDKEFRMPVLGSGVLNDDISSMSTSQKCIIAMIISFALLSNASSIYKIIKIDEVDSPLDTINRSAFFQALDTLMNYLKFDQCIMISHNVELNMSNTDIILLRNDDPDLKLDGNIIFNLEDYKG
ncbi:MAG: hypothetical protein IJ193_00400 [Bacilli bacterium]|nr:hypothetical protein [Bacilli bacterium]